MHWILGRITRCNQLGYPAARIIIEPDEATAAREAGMIEQREMMETELESGLAKERCRAAVGPRRTQPFQRSGR